MLQQLYENKFLACVAVVFVPFYSFTKVGEAIHTLKGIGEKEEKTIELGRGGDGSLLSYPSLLLFFIALALLPLHTPKLSRPLFCVHP